MKIAIIALTKNASKLGADICRKLNSELFIPEKFINFYDNAKKLDTPFSKNIKSFFREYEGIIFIMATGIVVRSIAPYIVSKTKDPAIIVLDEKGYYSISLLSGHIGGANELAKQVADITGAKAVITTATDMNNVPAADIISKYNNCYIENIENLKYINSDLANGKTIGLFTKHNITNTREDIIILNPDKSLNCNIVISEDTKYLASHTTLYMRPKILVLGLGCKKNKSYKEIKYAIEDFMNKNNKSIYSIQTISSIDLKSNETGILKFCEDYKIKFETFKAESLNKVSDKFSSSEFVNITTGVGNVCETSGFLSSDNGKQLISKTVYNGITLALFQKEYNIII